MTKGLLVGVTGFVVGAAVVWIAVINPAGWMWLSDVTGRSMDQGSPPAEASTGERPILHWRAPMDPSYVSDRPGASPMGMDLVPVYADEGATAPAGTVRIDPTFAQNIGVRTEPIVRRDIAMTIRTVGTLAHNDQQISWVNTKYDGWIEKRGGELCGRNGRGGPGAVRYLQPPARHDAERVSPGGGLCGSARRRRVSRDRGTCALRSLNRLASDCASGTSPRRR